MAEPLTSDVSAILARDIFGENAGKVRLMNLRTGDMLVAHYNPGDFDDEYTTNYAQVDIPGGITPLFQFGSGGSRDFNVQFFFNEYKQERNRPSRAIQMGVEESIRFLQEAMEPRRVMATKGGLAFTVNAAPDPLVLTWGAIKFDGVAAGITCILSTLRVNRNFFRKNTLIGLRATCDLTLQRFREVVL